MPAEFSFDVVSKIDFQEVRNAVQMATKEISQRFDFRGSKSEITLEGEEIKIIADDDFKRRSLLDILETKFSKRGVALKNLEYGKIEEALGGTLRQVIKIKQGIDSDASRSIVKDIKEQKLKVQAKIMEDQVRVTGKNKDDLQLVIKLLRSNDYKVELQFINYR